MARHAAMPVELPFAADDEQPWLIELQAHLRANRRVALRLFGLVLLGFLLAGALLPPRYAAVAQLAVLPAPEFTVRQDAGSHALSTSALAMDQVMTAETAILQSDALHADTLAALGVTRLYPGLDPAAKPGLLLPVLRALSHALTAPWRLAAADPQARLQDDALRRFTADLRVQPAKDSNVITVKLGNADPAMAALAVNTMLARYAARRHRLYNDPQLAVVRQETERQAQAVRDADAAFAAYKAAHGIADIATERDLLLRRRSETRTALAAAEAQRAGQQARGAAIAAAIAALPAMTALYAETDADTRVQAADVALADLRARIAQAAGQYRDGSRKMLAMQAELTAQETVRRRLLANPAPSQARLGRAPALDPLLLDQAHAAAEAAAADAAAASLRQELAGQDAALATLTHEETALAALARRKQAAEDGFAAASRVQDEQHMTEAEDALRMATVRVIEPARVPQRAVPLALYCAIAGLFAGAAVALGYLFAKYSWAGTVLTPEGLAAATGMPVFGVLQAGVDFPA